MSRFTRAVGSAHQTSDRPRWRIALRMIAGLSAIAALTAASAIVTSPAFPEEVDAVPDGFTLVQANIKPGMELGKFRADVAKVMAQQPDFVTYNEVPFRQDAELAPEGYALWRKPGQYTGATPVAYRTDRWTPIAQGTKRICNYREIPPKRHTMLGLRYANWVTLRSPEGRVVTVVSAHFPPLVKGMPDLLPRTAKHLAALVSTLSAQGPVLVGGDFNVHYASGRYPRELFTAAGMVPSYDTLGNYFPTGIHRGATIDYVFARSAGRFVATAHQPLVLNSDHRAVRVDHTWLVDAPTQTQTVSNNPEDLTLRPAVRRQLGATIASAPAGARVDIVTAGLRSALVTRRLQAADARGALVRLVTFSAQLTRRERVLADAFAATGRGSQVVQCRDECLDKWRANPSRPMSLLMVRGAGRFARVDVNRRLTLRMVTRPTTATVRTGYYGVSAGVTLLNSVQ